MGRGGGGQGLVQTLGFLVLKNIGFLVLSVLQAGCLIRGESFSRPQFIHVERARFGH